MKKKENNQEIIISGGSLSGISTWLHLYKYAPEIAEKTIVIEQGVHPRQKCCGGAAGGWTEQVLASLDIDLSVPSFWVDEVHYRLGEETMRYSHHHFFRIINRSVFDFQLAKQAIKKGLNLYQNERFLYASRKDANILVKTTKKSYKSTILIGADGATSSIRNLISQKTKPRFATGLLTYQQVRRNFDDEFKQNTAVLDFSFLSQGLQGYVWHFPYLDQETPMMNHGIFCTRFSPKKTTLKPFDILQKDLKMRNIHLSTDHLYGRPIPWYDHPSTLSSDRIILVGDAAGVEPLLGGGIHLALSYGDIAAKAIINAYETDDFSFETYTQSVQNHIVGKYISKFIHLARKLYGNQWDIKTVLKKTLTK